MEVELLAKIMIVVMLNQVGVILYAKPIIRNANLMDFLA